MANESPVFSTAYTPVYSNEAFALLGIVLSNLTNTPIETLFNEDYRTKLGLASTYFEAPAEISGNDVIPQSPTIAGWGTPFGVFSPSVALHHRQRYWLTCVASVDIYPAPTTSRSSEKTS